MNIIKRICKWNEERHPREFVKSLELAMLDEELKEFFDAEDKVDELDALVDTIFVAVGSMYKMGLDAEAIEKAIEIVCDANDTKPIKKNKAGVKASKGKEFVPPEPKLLLLLKLNGIDDVA